MPSQRIYWSGVAENATTASIPIDDESMRIREWAWHAFVSLSGTAPTSVQIAYSPDSPDVADGSSRWFAPSALLISGGAGDTYFTAKFRKIRAEVNGGDGTTSLTIEVR